ncbi:MAG: NHL repeat-containing protein [Candidatus Marinimicrobia bacterium]|nr:NHL repeat-containing protein [Candidatus Neomarinimicrobiota bacterium]MCF7902761.1 NHL repeat-containing protein [Candidatus Neomarinimicrobiota bacterium]
MNLKYLFPVLLISIATAQSTTWIQPNPVQSHFTWMDALDRFESHGNVVTIASLAAINGPFQDIQGEALHPEIRGLAGISPDPDGVWTRLPGHHWPEWRSLEAPPRFRGASGIWSTPAGKIFVSWRLSHTISEYSIIDGKMHMTAAWGSPGRTDGQLGEPVDIAVSVSGAYYILERLNNRISIFNSNRKFQKAIYSSREYPLHDPVAFTLHDGDQHWTHLRESFLVVIDADGKRMVKLDMTGRVLAVIDPDFPFESFEFRQVVTDYYGSIYVTDLLNQRVHKFDSELNYLVSLGPDVENVSLRNPEGIAIDNQFGQLWVSDSLGVHYYWMGTDTLHYRAGFSSLKNAVMGRFQVTEPAYVTITINNSEGELLETLVDSRKLLFESMQFEWKIPWGFKSDEVELKIKLTPAYASRRHFTKLVQQTIFLP